MSLTIAVAQAAKPVLAAFEPLAVFMMVGAGLMIAALVWAILSPDAPDDGVESTDDEVNSTGH